MARTKHNPRKTTGGSAPSVNLRALCSTVPAGGAHDNDSMDDTDIEDDYETNCNDGEFISMYSGCSAYTCFQQRFPVLRTSRSALAVVQGPLGSPPTSWPAEFKRL